MSEILKWKQDSHPSSPALWEKLDGGAVKCLLSPRNCVINEGGSGFCKVRVNRGGELVTLNYGKSVHHTEETIETEAVNHFAPGEPILSMGNIGCMLNCGYCHNWQTSQARFVQDKHVHYYTPEQVVQIALDHGIRVISWTYNDPVVWQEFVIDTAKLAKEAGLINLYKSAFFISPKAIDMLLPVMDIFSVSLKSIDPEYYRKITTGWVEPVLDGIKQVFQAKKHLEVSTLMVTDISDDEKTARTIADWLLTETDETIPLHFVRFHPDYKMRDNIRTPVPRLIRAREIAKEMGVKHVYLGNVSGHDATNTYCVKCNSLLVTRYGLNANILGLDKQGHCIHCGVNMDFKLLEKRVDQSLVKQVPINIESNSTTKMYEWHGDIASIHVQVLNKSTKPVAVYHRRLLKDGTKLNWKEIPLKSAESYRYIIAKSQPDEIAVEVKLPNNIDSNLHELFDRAFYPVVAIEEQGLSSNDITPDQQYQGKQIYDVMNTHDDLNE